MKFKIKESFRENTYNLMRKIGYHFLRRGGQRNESEFARPSKGYPRFHLFIKTKDDTLILNLHLDQKKPIYEGAPAHAGEYNSKLVLEEAERIKETLQ